MDAKSWQNQVFWKSVRKIFNKIIWKNKKKLSLVVSNEHWRKTLSTLLNVYGDQSVDMSIARLVMRYTCAFQCDKVYSSGSLSKDKVKDTIECRSRSGDYVEKERPIKQEETDSYISQVSTESRLCGCSIEEA